jgi:hypothetical protein
MNVLEKIQTGELTEYIKSVTKQSDSYRHKFYKESVKAAEQMGVHIEGFSPREILERKRPNEPEEVRAYRMSTWKAITKSLSEKILNTIARIFDPRFFKVSFPDKPPIVPDNENLGKYLTQDYGIYRSLWIFIRETLLKITLSDANAVCAVVPINMMAEGKEFFKPMPIVYRSEQVVDFMDEEYFTIYHKPEHTPGSKQKDGKLMIIDRNFIRMWAIKGSEANLILEYNHDLGVVPAFRVGGQIEGNINPYWYSSFVAGIQPHWDKVVTMVSDLDGSIVNHLFPERWEWQDSCDNCSGSGFLTDDDIDLGIAKGKSTKQRCGKCEGRGFVTNKSPFGVIALKRSALNPDLPPPTPPAAYIPKDIAPLQELKKSIDSEIFAGYSAINMEILHKVGENQSGIAKTIDRQDFYSLLVRVSGHIFDYSVKNIIELTARWRMSTILSPVLLEQYIDGISISKPKEFDVLSMNMLMEELKQAGTSNVSVSYYRNIEAELINNKFSNNENERKKNMAIIKLKPFPNKTVDQLLTARAGNAITQIDFIRNENIDDLVTIAMEENDGFLDLPFMDQLEIINQIIVDKYIQVPLPNIPVEA